MISRVVKCYEDYQSNKLQNISTAALVVETNIRKAVQGLEMNEEQNKFFENAIFDLKLIQNELTKNDFKLEENKHE